MTIECTACHARYTIADSLVPPQGARVRCRKCSAVFTVKPSGPVVSPEPLPVVPPAAEAAPEQHAAPAPHAASEPHAAAPLRTPEPPPGPEPPHAPLTPVSPAASPSASQEAGFERFPTHSVPTGGHAPAAAFERFPSPTGVEHAEPPRATLAPAEPAPRAEAAVHAEPVHPEPVRPAEPAHTEPARPAEPARTEPARPAAPSHAESQGVEAAHRPRISATTLPDNLSPEELQRHERARRLARVLASDIAIYNREKRERGIRDGNLVAVLGYEIKKSWETYKERVGADFANSTPYFRDALNEIVAEGKKIF